MKRRDVLVCLTSCGHGRGNRARLATCLTAHQTNRVVACRSVRHSSPRPLPHLPIGAFFFVVSALADVPSARLTLSAYPPERSGVDEGELNAGCKSAPRVAAPSGCLRQGDMRRLGRGASPRRPLSRVSPGAKRSRRRRAQCGVQIRRAAISRRLMSSI